jgi:hypothetical protein
MSHDFDLPASLLPNLLAVLQAGGDMHAVTAEGKAVVVVTSTSAKEGFRVLADSGEHASVESALLYVDKALGLL